MIGFVFADESEAKAFWKKVIAKKDQKECKLELHCHFPLFCSQCSSETCKGEEEENKDRWKNR